MRTNRVIGLLLAVCAGATLVACGAERVEPSPLPATSGPAETAPAGRPSPRPEDVVAWQRFRHAFGLRSDEVWVRIVADNPLSANEIGVPLLHWEIARVAALNRAAVDLAPLLEDYGRLFPSQYAGTYLDGPIVVIQFSDQVDQRRAALQTLLGGNAPFEVRQVRYSLDDLDAFAKGIETDDGWFSSVAAKLTSANPSVQDNKVNLTYGSNDEVELQIAAHFGNPDWLTLTREGPLPWAGGYGRLVIRIVDRAGDPVEAGILPTPADSRVSSSFLPQEVAGLYEQERIEAIAWKVVVTYFDGEDEESTSVMVRVPAGGVGRATVVVDR